MEEFPRTKPIRLRLYVVDSATGSPLPNITMQTHWSVGGLASNFSPRLRTDANGYVSFALYPPTGLSSPDVSVFPVGNPSAKASFRDSDLIANNSPRLMLLDPSLIVEPLGSGDLPSMSQPDAIDLLSTSSATQVPSINLGLGLCGQLIPNLLHASCFDFHLFSITDFTPQLVTFLTPPGASRPNYIARQAFTGFAIEMEQCWSPTGHSVGQILNSFPLAPCETVNVAVLDYNRRERSSRNESTQRNESSIYQSNRDTLQYQTFMGMLSQAKTEAGFAGGAKIDQIGTVSGTFGASTVDQFTVTKALNHVTESLNHSASAVALINSMVVMEASAEERKVLTTRTIGNHNRCHTLTIMYYEVMRNFLVTTTAKRGREVLFIQGPDAPWTIARAHNWAHIIRENLLDESLIPCLDELGEALCCLSAGDPGAACDVESCEACCCANRLVDHLNAHTHYYNAATGVAQDMQSRVAWMIEAEYLGQPLLSVIDPEPLGAFGGYIAFALLNTSDILINTPARIQNISLPTKGVFAEGLLGSCNTCEVIEEGVYRDFKNDECGCKPLSVPSDFSTPGSSLYPASGLNGTNIGTLLNYPENPFPDAPNLLSGLTTAFLNPALLTDNDALTAAKEIALKIAEKLQAPPAQGEAKPSPDQEVIKVFLIKILLGFAGVPA